MDLAAGDADARAALCAVVALMDDADPAVRTQFSRAVGFLLTATSGDSEQGSLSEASGPWEEISDR